MTDVNGLEVTFEMEDETAADTDPTIAIKDLDAASITAALVARQPAITIATDDDTEAATDDAEETTTDGETATDEL